MRQKVVFTVITPVYNGAQYIEETINSVLAQTQNEITEYLVIDDGSTDETPHILKNYQNHIKVITKQNEGQAAAINLGLSLAKGKYSVIVNADDPLISKELFIRSAEILDSHPETVLTYPDWVIIDSQGKVVRQIETVEYSKMELVGNFNCLVGPGGIFRTRTGTEVGGWDPSLRFVPDYKFWLNLSTKGEFKRIPEILAAWRTHESSISVGGRSLQMAKERIFVMEDFLAKHPQNSEISSKALSNAYYHAALLTFFDPRVPSRQYLKKSYQLSKENLIRKNRLVLLFLILSPLSTMIAKITLLQRILVKIVQKKNLI